MFLGLCQTFLLRVHWGGLRDKPKEPLCGRLHRLKVFPPSAYSLSVYWNQWWIPYIHVWVLSFLTFQLRFSNSLLEVPVGEDIRDLKIRQWWQQQECQKNNRFKNQNNNFACASRLFVHDYDVKMPYFTFYRGSIQATTKFPLSFWTWMWFLRIQLWEGSPTFDKVSD